MNCNAQYIHGSGIVLGSIKKCSKVKYSYNYASQQHSPSHMGIKSVTIRPKAISFNKVPKDFFYITLDKSTSTTNPLKQNSKLKDTDSNQLLISSSIQTNRISRLNTAKLAIITLMNRTKPRKTDSFSFSPQINHYEKTRIPRISKINSLYSSIAKIKGFIRAKDLLLYKDKEHSFSRLMRIKDWISSNNIGRNHKLANPSNRYHTYQAD